MAGDRFDAVVLGSGVAGCTAALALAGRGARVALVTKDGLGESTSRLAQGGIAAALPGTGDRPADHFADTLGAGAGLCDEAATRLLVESAPGAIEGLLALGTRLDRDGEGGLARSREGGHRAARVVHAGGAATGAEVVRALAGAVAAGSIVVREGWLALELVLGEGRCRGVDGQSATGGAERLEAGAVVLATGGDGQLFALTTNPAATTGDGLALALRAGVPVADLEFVQFHPTALAVETSPRPLLSEALRGEGALLVDASGRRFVDELLPRDVVARAIADTTAAEGTDHVYLDARPVEAFAARFPTLAAALAAAGFDPARDLLPVGPAAHYLCGGVLTDLRGASALPGLYAVGEVACTGVHGANRLASNSLLEGLVFGNRAAEAIAGGAAGPEATGALGPLLDPGAASPGAIPVRPLGLEDRAPGTSPSSPPAPPAETRATGGELATLRAALARAMSAGAGVERDGQGLAALAVTLDRLTGRLEALGVLGGREDRRRAPADRVAVELANLLEVASATVAAAGVREESRGAHHRRDHPDTSDAWRCRLACSRPAGGAGARRRDDGEERA